MEAFTREADFERALIAALQRQGWKNDRSDQNNSWEDRALLCRPTEEDLLQNWADILYQNNQDVDRLNHVPLLREEMQELIEKIKAQRTPLALNGFINGRTITITRKNPEDTLHFGKEVSLKIYDRFEIMAGQSVYQIVEQPIFPRHDAVLQDRRGDVMLLINGMPLFHIELKRSGVPVMEAVHQIEKYAHEGVFTGLFSLVQIFVAMNPEETLYFANPGPDGKFNPDFYFHWADMNNEPMNEWHRVTDSLLSIPMAHRLIGLYTVADDADGVLKVLRSYQFWAVNQITTRVQRQKWESGNQLGGYIWHTTGSGKTMTSFKAAQLISYTKDADKVVFLMDRIELGVQSLKEYRAFADRADDVQDTEDTIALIAKLKSKDPKNMLIVSSIQKMSNIKDDAESKLRGRDLEEMQSKRLVFIIDECHRSTFGDMLSSIKRTFPNALFFGFTGTPVFTENERALSTTSDIFGDELHRYSIADGIRDKNVLGFDPLMVCVYPDKKLRQLVALHEAGASSEEEVLQDPKKSAIYYEFLNDVPMAGSWQEDGTYEKGIEDYLHGRAFRDLVLTDEYQWEIVDHIRENWNTLSRGSKFHAIFATDSIPEAVRYYRKFRERYPELRVTGLFDPTIDNKGGKKTLDKEEGLKAMLEDYNARYGQRFDIGGYDKFKKDVAARLAHKKPYERVKPEQQLDLLIVVNQMLTGFDSKWINTLYLDKVLEYQNLIQAFSRTNRLYNSNEKPFGSIRYYRYPHSMKRNIEAAVKLYSGDRPRGLFADHLPDHLRHMNESFEDMMAIFKEAGIPDLDHLPEDMVLRAKFAETFREFCTYLQAAEIQGFTWDQQTYFVEAEEEGGGETIVVKPTEAHFMLFLQRYKELRPGKTEGDGGDPEETPTFSLDPYLTELETGKIDNDYMNSRFRKYLRKLNDGSATDEERAATLEELHKSFAYLSQEEQRLADLFLADVGAGTISLDTGKGFRDYLAEYANREKTQQRRRVVKYTGCDETLLTEMTEQHIAEDELNQYGRFDRLKKSIDIEAAKRYFEELEGKPLPLFIVNNRLEQLLKEFILAGGFDIPIPGVDRQQEE